MLEHFTVLQNKYLHLKELTHYIRENFEVGDILPSDRELAAVVGYTRSTIRESLIRLECFGFISIEHGKPMVYKNKL